MKTPPLILLATLLFWGWQSNLVVYGAIAGVLLEASRWIKFRWDLDDTDFNRIWSFCGLMAVVLAAYVFTNNDEGGGVRGMFQQGPAGLRNASISTQVATTTVFRWMPLILLPFILAQAYNVRSTVPLTAISLVLRVRRRRGEQTWVGRYVDMSYPYFFLCVLAAGFHTNQGSYTFLLGYFFGTGALILWVLWMRRSPRYGPLFWMAGLTVVMTLGSLGLIGILQVEKVVQNLDARLMQRFFHSRTDPSQAATAIGQIGELKLSPRIVIRLEPGQVGVAPPYLREASYRTYTPFNQAWLARGLGTNFVPQHPLPDNSTWVLVPEKKAKNTVNIACYLEGRSEDGVLRAGVLPLPTGACRVENLPVATSSLQVNGLGAVLASGPGLLIFNTGYGPGATIDSAPDVASNQLNDLQVPVNEVPALDQVIAEMNIPKNAGDAEKRLAVQIFFAQHFKYSTWQGSDVTRAGQTKALSYFLTTGRSGHCEYFATATVLLLRELGIPARYAVGYSVHEASGSGYVVRERDAHAWCLVWNRHTKVWDDLDTTPPSWVGIESRNTGLMDALSDIRSWLVFQFEKLRWQQANLRQYILWTFVPVMVVMVYYIIFQRRTKARAGARKKAEEDTTVWPGHDSVFYQLEAALAARGLPRQPQDPLSDWLERTLTEPSLAGLRTPLRELLQLHYRYRFDPMGLKEGEKKAFVANAEEVMGKVAVVTDE